MEKTLLLVVSYDTTHKETCHKTIGAVERHLVRTFPAYEVRRAFTGRAVCRILEQRGETVEHLSAALEKAVDDGFRNIILQPTHIIYGEEYAELLRQARAFAEKFDQLSIGVPLLSDTDDLQAIARAISGAFPSEDGKAVVLVGHGAKGHVNHTYAAMQTTFHVIGRSDILVGTLGTWSGVEEVALQLLKQGYEKTVLSPLLLTAGRHFKDEIAGNQRGSWRSHIQEQGISVETSEKSLGECGAVWKIYEEHVRKAKLYRPFRCLKAL